jgi:hypothetical protein
MRSIKIDVWAWRACASIMPLLRVWLRGTLCFCFSFNNSPSSVLLLSMVLYDDSNLFSQLPMHGVHFLEARRDVYGVDSFVSCSRVFPPRQGSDTRSQKAPRSHSTAPASRITGSFDWTTAKVHASNFFNLEADAFSSAELQSTLM